MLEVAVLGGYRHVVYYQAHDSAPWGKFEDQGWTEYQWASGVRLELVYLRSVNFKDANQFATMNFRFPSFCEFQSCVFANA